MGWHFGICLYQFGIQAAQGDKLLMPPLIHDLSLMEDDDFICIADGGQAMGDANGGAAFD